MSKHDQIYDNFVNNKTTKLTVSAIGIEAANKFWNKGGDNYTALQLSKNCPESICHAVLYEVAFQYTIGYLKGNFEGFKEALSKV